jgi:hypothetical protein
MIKLAPRHFILPLIALLVIASLPDPAGGSAARDAICGPAASSTTDPGLRRTFQHFRQRQSAAADRICAFHRNAMASLAH